MSRRSLPFLLAAGLALLVVAAALPTALAQGTKPKRGGVLNTFFLRRNVKWHDGKPFTARDVKYTFDVAREAPDPPAKLHLKRRRSRPRWRGPCWAGARSISPSSPT
jgi:hypothetical protein